MLRLSLQAGLLRALTRRADSRAFPLVVAGAALAAELSMSVPFASLLMAAVLLAPRRWVSIAVWASLGAAVGALALYLVFHHLGWNRLFAAYPDVVRSAAWRDATHWLEHYGVVSLLVIAALPLPLTPALMFAAISRLPVVEVIAALWLGKLAKYCVYAWLASRFPDRLMRHDQRHVDAMRAALGNSKDDPRSSAPMRGGRR
ncbi:YqaA family protein [Ralstonia solanacearum]|uniref:YqaA family protein n=1 Tax=Ralstonia solanacearum TaxID=305 RepID=UPI0005AC18FA|nr:VTT domain-containing protein [Ralstonia solanacearum]MDC6177085.1 VTT domain-containing protein [Ralstonia solanacearum]MDC6238383.1 VTT domain-containing protein [Ralstonia solanacearum]